MKQKLKDMSIAALSIYILITTLVAFDVLIIERPEPEPEPTMLNRLFGGF